MEQAYIDSEQDIMRVQENLIVAAFKRINEFCERDLNLLEIEELAIPKTPFPELRYPALYDLLEELGEPTKYGEDHSWQAEEKLGTIFTPEIVFLGFTKKELREAKISPYVVTK